MAIYINTHLKIILIYEIKYLGTTALDAIKCHVLSQHLILPSLGHIPHFIFITFSFMNQNPHKEREHDYFEFHP